MAEAEYKDVRVEESLRVKIGEAKNLPASSFSGSGRNTCCAIKIDSEEIFRTSTVEKSTNPFFGAEFQGEIPKKFRFLSFYVYEVGNKNKVLGKVSLKKEELYKYHQKEHWFPLTYQDSDIEVQGKVQVEVKLDEFLTPTSEMSHRMTVRVLECGDLTVINGACNPYAVVTLSYGKTKAKEVKKTAVRKKTICPQFDESFSFYIDNKGQSQEKNLYAFEDFMAGELSVSLFHDDSKVSREVLGNIFKGAFLGEVKIPIHDLDISRPHKAWYCLQAKEQNRTSDQSLGSIRLRISYTADYVFPSKYYDGLRNLVLASAETKPFTSSAVFILGEIVSHRENVVRENAAQPLVKLFLHHGKLVPLVHALADWEMSCTVGNSLLTKMVDELMKIVGMPYLQDTLKSFIDQVVNEAKPCEIDPSRLRDGEDAETDLANLFTYVSDAVNTIVSSGLICPPIMRDVFSMLRSQAMLNYPDNTAVRYHAVTSFIFLRFFTAAIMGPNLFDLYSDILDPPVQRTFTLISKGISGLVTLVSSKSNNVTAKEEYMAPLFEMFPKSTQTEIKMFLDIISCSSGPSFKGIEAPIILKEGSLIKRAQGRKRFGLKNFKKRFFRLSNQTFSYSKNKGDKHYLFEIPVTDILAVERLEEESFKMKYMFQVVHAERALYIQASNCVEEKEWLDILAKICKSNKNRLKSYHPAAFVNNHWLCCKSSEHSFPGCTPVTGDMPLCDLLAEAGEVDSDREVEKIHSIFLSAIELLDALQEMCGSQAVYSGDTEIRNSGLGSNIEDPSTCFATIAEIQRCIITLEQEHIQYMRSVQRRTVIGSIDTPIGDESSADLVRNMNRSSERLSRHGSRSSNASNISRRSFRGCRSRGGSFREREKGKTEGEGVRKSLSGDVAACSHSLGVEFGREVKKAASYDVMTIDSREGGSDTRTQTSSSDGRKSTDGNVIESHVHRSYIGTNTSSRGTDSGIKDCSASSPTDMILSATDSDVFTSPEVRGPKTSTGFIPSAFPYSDDHIASFNHVNSEPRCSSENMSITPDIRVGHPNSDCDLSHFSSSSHNLGVLETSLDSNDVVTTTINVHDAQPEAQHHAGGGWAGSSLPQPSSEHVRQISQNTGSHINVSIEFISDPSLTSITCVVGNQKTIAANESQASSLYSHSNSEVSLGIASGTSSKEIGELGSSNVLIEYTTGGTDNCVQNHQVLPHVEFNQNRSHKEQDSQCLNLMPGQSFMWSSAEHSIKEPPDHAGCQRLSVDFKSAPGNHIANQQRVLEADKVTQTLLEQVVKQQPHLDDRDQQDGIGFPNQCSDEATQLKGATKQPVEYTRIDVHNVANGFSSVEGASRQHDPSFASTQNDTVRYSVPELRSSCRSRLPSADPQQSGSVMAVDSSSSTPEVSPSDVAVLEMLTSSESNSSQGKL